MMPGNSVKGCKLWVDGCRLWVYTHRAVMVVVVLMLGASCGCTPTHRAVMVDGGGGAGHGCRLWVYTHPQGSDG